MIQPASISHAALHAALADLRYGVGASDLHGSLTGFLCGGGKATAANWLRCLEIEPEDGDKLANPVLDNVFQQCHAQLDDPEFGFEPLLPDENEPLALRADALVDWCRGFLGGLGLAGVNPQRGLSDDGAEILRDFGTIAASRFEVDDAEEDESALSEVLEFIRVAVLLLHTELESAGPRSTVH
jgi:uncharacterized protein YgfB (UPF0149 family)